MELKRNLSENISLPKEVITNLPFLTLLGKEQLTIENHKGILAYTSTNVNISTKIGTLAIEGSGLLVKQLTSQVIVVGGVVTSVVYRV